MISSDQARKQELDAISFAAQSVDSTMYGVELSVPDIRCAGCIHKIESALMKTPGVCRARVNLTARRVRIHWLRASETPPFIDILERTGFHAQIADVETHDSGNSDLSKHIRALAVAGFAAGNVMMLSWSVWSGADDKTRHFFHVLSAVIAVPALVFSSRLFFTSAWQALQHRTTNMDVPICVGIVLTTLLSVYDTLTGGEHVYFDAAIMLVFFLLIGRTLDTRMRAKAGNAMSALKGMQPTIAHVVLPGETQHTVTAVSDVLPGDMLDIGVNERVPVDCQVEMGASAIDMAIVTGESVPVEVSKGAKLYAGCMNLEADITARATDTVNGSFLSRIEHEMAEAESGKGHYQQMADTVVSYYTPFVHVAALLGFLGWLLVTRDWYQSVTVGVAILIITCPCALGLAVPIARVIAAQQLVKRGVLMKNGRALEPLAVIDSAVFDKTGTLTTSMASLDEKASQYDHESLQVAQAMSHASEHPYARAILNSSASIQLNHSAQSTTQRWEVIDAVPGAGIEARRGKVIYRLGRASWALSEGGDKQYERFMGQPVSVLSCNGRYQASFRFVDTLRTSALPCIRELDKLRISTAILSGDQQLVVESVARALGVEHQQHSATPRDKVEWVQTRLNANGSVLMVGDGINDSPALTAATVSMVPGTAANMARKIGDFVLLADRLTAIPEAILIARQARQVMRQNLCFAVGYNIIAMPLAMAGLVTPLVAAIAMSLSSAVVVANSLRLSRTAQALELVAGSVVETSADIGSVVRTRTA